MHDKAHDSDMQQNAYWQQYQWNACWKNVTVRYENYYRLYAQLIGSLNQPKLSYMHSNLE